MTVSSTDRIHKEITLRASLSRVWRALTDSGEFGEWFRVALGGPFRTGETIMGRITHPGCEHMVFEAVVERMDPEQTFSYRWWPQGPEEGVARADQPSTLVEFHIDEVEGGTRLTVTESGFDALPDDNRLELFQRNEGGWTGQMDNIKSFVDG